jgi:hypothetical protein
MLQQPANLTMKNIIFVVSYQFSDLNFNKEKESHIKKNIFMYIIHISYN